MAELLKQSKLKGEKIKPLPVLDPKEYIVIKGARVHNLKNVSVAIPCGKFTVITGLSGSGKSSLAFDTLFAEGQRRYVESLSSYARQFLGRLDKPDVDSIIGISPAVAIEQKVTSRTSRSTVGTSTEIYDYMKLLFARVGRTYSPISGKEVKRDKVEDVVEFVKGFDPETRFLILAPLVKSKDITKKLQVLTQQGFSRIVWKGEMVNIEDVASKVKAHDEVSVVVDRITADSDEENLSRIADSVESAFFEGLGECVLYEVDNKKSHHFSGKFELDGMTFEEPSVNLFTFNNPVGACKTCEGFGSVIGIDENLVMPNKKLSVYQDAIVCWRGEVMSEWKNQLVMKASKFNFPIHKPIAELTKQQYDLLWKGNEHFSGLNNFFKYLEAESYKIQYRVMLSRYRGKTRCPECNGTRLRGDASYVKVGAKSISDLVSISIEECLDFFSKLKLNAHDEKIAKRLLTEIRNRLKYLTDVGLGYLTLNRLSNTLSGGESQRINLATCLGSALVGSMYILDEPSIGLHPRDTQRLIGVLKNLRDQGNTVIVVEHDEEIMREADLIIDMGPEAGSNGGHVVFTGTVDELAKKGDSLTSKYLRKELNVVRKSNRKPGKDKLVVRGARENSLKDIDVEFPLRCFTVVSGVSGSGKSTLIRNILYPALVKELGGLPTELVGEYDSIEGDIQSVQAVEFVDQNPIGKSSRSNPVTYVKAYDEIRNLYSLQTLSKQRGYKPSHFSFNVEGGRCESCEGEGQQTISMQFMADIKLQCEACKGKRFKEEIIEVTYKGKSISDILDMTVDEAVLFFAQEKDKTPNKNIVDRLTPLQQVGLGYIGLGQSSSSLSGGEAQRIKLASFLTKGAANNHTLFIFDEPTTGLHFHDVRKLLDSFEALLAKGHSIIAIEHNLDVIRSADWLIDMGPEGGDAGGQVVYTGLPAGCSKVKKSYTGGYLSS
ncbi:MAG: excinuclease ABC subunit UvrA [Flavobacteriales bacterium]|nr:excinuclease ABC subunit UvrA [Flavobacteriales bacterium]